MNFGGKYIYNDDKEKSKYNEVCERMLAELVRSIVIILLAILVGYSVFVLGFLHAILFGNTRVTVFSTELPFFDINSNFGYGINILEQLIVAAVSLSGNISIEVAACIAYNVISISPELIHLEAGELENELKSNGINLGAVKRLRHILMRVHDAYG